MFDRVAKCRTRHGCGVAIEIVAKAPLVSLPCFSDPPAHRLLHQVVRVVRKNLSNPESVVHVAAADEEPGAHDRCPPLVPMRRTSEPIERFTRLVPQVATHDI